MLVNNIVAVVIPMYNCADTIDKVLDSIRCQTKLDLIKYVILINDGSTDNTLEVVGNYSSSLPLKIIDKVNGGVASARNEGLKHIDDAEFVAFCDSDDLWLPNKIEEQLRVFIEHPEIDVLGGPFNNNPLRIGLKVISSLHKATVKEMLIRNYPQPSTVLMRSSVYHKFGGFDETQRYAEDGNYFLKLAANCNLYYYPHLLIKFGFGKRGFGGTGLSGNLKGMYEGNIKNLKEMKKLNYISIPFYFSMRLFHWLKYLRRVIISTL